MNMTQMKVAEVLLKNCPNLVTSEESINTLVMKDVIDFNTGMNLIQNLKSTESDETVEKTVVDNKDVEQNSFPSTEDVVVFKTVVELSSDDDKKSIQKALDDLNLAFQTAFKKRKADIFKVVKNIVEVAEITKQDTSTASNIMDEIKKENYILFK
jgi:hypothetical protein